MAPSALYTAKLTGLLREAGVFALDGSALQPVECSVGVAAGEGTTAYVLMPEGQQLAAFGPALVWGIRRELTSLTLICDQQAGDVARRSELFSRSDVSITVWSIDGTAVSPADSVPALTPPQLSEAVMIFAPVIEAAGARAVDDHGRLTAEVVGLEIARVSDDADTPPRLEVGVGQADRELHDYVHSSLTDSEALQRAVATVLPLRTRNEAMHPLNRVARQRWLREMILADPSVVGAASLLPLPPLVPKGSLLGSEPAAAASGDGSSVVVCSVGIDPGLVPEAADYRVREGIPGAELVIVVPERDNHPITSQLAGLLPNARVLPIQPPW